MLSTERRVDLLALVACLLLAAVVLRDGMGRDRVLVATDPLTRSAPWNKVLEHPRQANHYLVDQPRLYWPYLVEAARVYAGEADAVWTSRGGGGQPFLGNISSALLHPLTLLAAVLPIGLVPWVQGVLTLGLTAFFTWLFLRRMQVSPAGSTFGALAFGFGGHQVLWLQYALSHTLLALPFTFWAVERVVEDGSRRRLAVLAAGFALFVLGGHPETGFVAGGVAGLWALYRLWDPYGRMLVLGAGVLALLLSAVQWLPFYEYVEQSRGLRLREIENLRLEGGVSLGASLIYAALFLAGVALLRAAATRGFSKRVLAVAACALSMVMARRMGMAVSSGVLVLPELYGNPTAGGAFTGAQDFPGLLAGYAGVLAPVLLALGFFIGLGHGFIRFFAVSALLLWGAAFHLPGVEGLVRLVPGLSEVAPTRLLGPVGFATACGGAMVIDRLCGPGIKPGVLVGVARLIVTVLVSLLCGALALQLPINADAPPMASHGLRGPDPATVHSGASSVPVCLELDRPLDDLRVMVDGLVLRAGPAAATLPGEPLTVRLLTHRMEEGRHRLVVTARQDGDERLLADQPLIVHRARQLSVRDLLVLALGFAALGWLVLRPHSAPWVLALVAGLDVLSLGHDYNEAGARAELFPPTGTEAFLRRQPPPFRIFSEGTVLPPDTQFVVGVDHIMSYDNLGYDRTYRWLSHVPMDMDAFASFTFSRATVDYASRRFDTLDVRYILTDTGTDLSDIHGLRLVHESETRIWENTDNLGRAFVVGEALDVHSDPLQRLQEADASRVALLEEPLRGPLGGSGRVISVEHRGREIAVTAEVEGEVLLVLAENRAPGWQVSVDGGPFQETLPADVAWQAVRLSSGRHELLFDYDPPGYRWGLRLSLVGAAVWLLMLLFPRHLFSRRPEWHPDRGSDPPSTSGRHHGRAQ